LQSKIDFRPDYESTVTSEQRILGNPVEGEHRSGGKADSFARLSSGTSPAASFFIDCTNQVSIDLTLEVLRALPADKLAY
jgi:hypothetical protein